MMTTSITSYIDRAYNAFLSHKTHLQRNPSHIIYYLGLLGFYWYALTIFMGPDGHLIAVGLILLAFFGYWLSQIWLGLCQCSLFWVALATTFYILMRTLLASWQFQDIVSFQIEMGLKMAHMGGATSLLLVPWFYESNKSERWDLFFLLVFISFLGNIYLTLSWTQFWNIISLNNYYYIKDLLRVNPNTVGLLAGLLLNGLLTVGLKKMQEFKKNGGIFAFAVILIAWIVIIWIFAKIVINTNSRSGWIAIAIVLALSLIIQSYFYMFHIKYKKKIFYLLITCFGIFLIFLSMHNSGKLIQEFNKEKETLNKLSQLQFSNLPKHSLGKRIELWKLGFNIFKERPLFGWGPGTIKYLIKDRGIDSIKNLGHFHSAIFQIVTQFGLIGLVLFLSQIVIVGYEIIKQHLQYSICIEWTIFLVGTFLMYLIFSSVNSPFHHEQYRYFVIIIISVTVTLQLICKNNKN